MPSFAPGQIPVARPATAIYVVRYNPALAFPRCYTILPNIVALQVDWKVGATPRVANFRYQFNPIGLGPGFPSRVEQVLSLSARGPYIVRQDDHLCILKDDNDGTYTVMFDGFAQVPEGNLSRETEVVTFQALGIECREWDRPLPGGVFRQGPDPTVVVDVRTDLPARFNPGGLPNMTPSGSDSGTANKYPVFFDLKQVPDVRRLWTTEAAARYVVGVGNPDFLYVDTPAFTNFATLLNQRTPTGPTFDPNNAATYTASDIPAQDIDMDGDPWPVALDKLISPHGFDMFFALDSVGAGTPNTRLDFIRYDGGILSRGNTVSLQAAGATFDPGFTNVTGIKLSRDSSKINNTIIVHTEPVQFEASFILAPGFLIAGGDAATASNYVEGDPNYTGTNTIKYREWVFAEGGDGFWNTASSTWIPATTTLPSLDGLLGAPIPGVGAAPAIPVYANRRRKPERTLATVDSNGKPRTAELWVSSDYAGGATPKIWDGTGTWQKVTGGFELLKDRIGIRFTISNPDDISIAKATATGGAATAETAHGKLRLVKSFAAPSADYPLLYFRLTCVIDGDRDIEAIAPRRPNSTTAFTIIRRVDARDRFGKQVIHAPSQFNQDLPPFDFTPRDDTANATSYAGALRSAHDTATFAGSITIPRITLAYDLGDSIRSVNGRNLSLGQNVATDQGEAAKYPVIVGVTWNFDGQQSTTLQLQDLRAEPSPERTRGFAR